MASTPGSRKLLPAALAVLALSIALAAWFLRPQPDLSDARPTHLFLPLPDGYQFVSRDRLPLGAPQPCLDISGDGRIVVSVIENEGGTMLYRRTLDETNGEIIPGTEGAYHPRISPDGTRITFLSEDNLKRVDVEGVRVTPIVDVINPFGQCWYDDQQVLVVTRQGAEIVLVDVQRNTVTPILNADIRVAWPETVPGVEATLINRTSIAKNDETEADPIVMNWLDGSRQEVLGVQGTAPRFFGDDLLLFVRDGALMATPFSASDPTRQHPPQTVLEGLVVESSIGHYALSGEGTLVYVEGDWLVGKSLVWDDGRGTIRDLGFPSLGYGDFELSPDGKRVAITIGTRNSSIWVCDLDRGTRSVLANEGTNYSATWSPDGSRVAYSTRDGEIWTTKIQTVGSNSPPEVIFTSGDSRLSPDAWHEGAGLLLTRTTQRNDIIRIDPDRPEEIEELVSGPASEWGANASPNGKWMAYTSDESGRYEIYARGLAPGSRSWPVSVDGGEEPIWNSEGTAIFFRNGNRFLRTEVLEASEDGTRFRAAVPAVHVTGAYSNVPGVSYDVGPDDERLLLLKTEGGTERPSHLNVILNFDQIIEARVR